LDIQGIQMSSEQFSKAVAGLSYQGKNQVTFVIGGSNGLSTDVLKRANEKLSFSNMTFPHQLMKLILLEQVYRGFKIQRREPYHKRYNRRKRVSSKSRSNFTFKSKKF